MTTRRTDRYGRTWALSEREVCATCGQPDNVAECTHERLAPEDVFALGGGFSDMSADDLLNDMRAIIRQAIDGFGTPDDFGILAGLFVALDDQLSERYALPEDWDPEY